MASPATAPNPLKGEGAFHYKGEHYRFTFPWSAIVQFESATGFSYAQLQMQMELCARGGAWPLLHHIGEFMRAGLSEHHPDMTAELGAEIFLDELARKVALGAINAGAPKGDGSAAGEAQPASNPSGGSKTSSDNGSRRAAPKKPSGKRRRD